MSEWAGHSVPVSPENVSDALKRLKKGRACGDDTLIAEMLKTGHQGLINVIAATFTDILHGKQDVPEVWCKSRLVVLFKKGDATLPKNYRPIAIIPVLCKLFSGILLARTKHILDGLQEPEQAGFRPDYSCSDIVMFLRMVAEKADEWGQDVWVASLDLEKAFDKLFHASVIKHLAETGVENDVVQVLWRIYRQQRAYISMDGCSSRLFDVLREVRQGNPLSPILFNNVTRQVFAELKAKWAREGRGTLVCGGAALSTHAMFADDTTPFASSRASLVRMIQDVKLALSDHGLNLNIDKCVVQASTCNARCQPLLVDGVAVPMVPPSIGFKVLGTQLTLHGRTSAEFKARISASWAKFYTLWPVLGKRDGNLHKRLRLFDSSVSQTVLWCCESWLLILKEKRLLKSTQNQMLRRIAGPRRRPLEPWVDWIKRSTRAARAAATQAGVRFWLEAHLQSKWRWAGHVIRMEEDRLASRSLQWRDSVWWSQEKDLPVQLRTRRPHRTKWFRWEDELKRYAVHCGWASWQEMARQGSVWHEHCSRFVQFTPK